MMQIYKRIEKGLIVSCQALEGEPMFGSDIMAKMAFAAFLGGARGIRANSPEDIKMIKQKVDLPVIGLYKRHYPSSEVYITPTYFDALQVAEAGADMIAIDATKRIRPRENIGEIIDKIHTELKLPVLADIATIEEAVFARKNGADLVATTLFGYTEETKFTDFSKIELIQNLTRIVDCPVIAEGNIRSPQQAVEALEAGAFAVVVGSAITRPLDITKWFVEEMQYKFEI